MCVTVYYVLHSLALSIALALTLFCTPQLYSPLCWQLYRQPHSSSTSY